MMMQYHSLLVCQCLTRVCLTGPLSNRKDVTKPFCFLQETSKFTGKTSQAYPSSTVIIDSNIVIFSHRICGSRTQSICVGHEERCRGAERFISPEMLIHGPGSRVNYLTDAQPMLLSRKVGQPQRSKISGIVRSTYTLSWICPRF
jgi:hypothetical protein